MVVGLSGTLRSLFYFEERNGCIPRPTWFKFAGEWFDLITRLSAIVGTIGHKVASREVKFNGSVCTFGSRTRFGVQLAVVVITARING
jgi:hypothetical protein